MDYYGVPSHQQQFEFELKRSRFLTSIDCVSDKSAAKAFIKSVQGIHPDANHHCWAMVAGAPDDIYQHDQSDDGEPKGTAGKPMLKVLQHSGLGNTVVVVTRYFGGVKLGAGGLLRAYSQSVSQALSQLLTERRYILKTWRLDVPYALYASLEHKLQSTPVQIGEKRFAQRVSVELFVPESAELELQRYLNDLGKGEISFSIDD